MAWPRSEVMLMDFPKKLAVEINPFGSESPVHLSLCALFRCGLLRVEDVTA